MTQHSRQPSYASSFVSTSAYSHHGLGINSSRQSKIKSPVKIGPWKLGKTLGKGANGRVFLATNSNTGKKAAVKIVSKAALAPADQTQDSEDKGCDSAGLSYGIEREIIIMKLLNHKNVLSLYDVWETEKSLYLVLEYVEGGELFDLLVDSGPLPEKTAIAFFRQIILGASYCHSLGICHRDLKPENILLDNDLNVKIADFGMAALESGRLLETSCGSPHYAAPEIVSGLHYHGAESDVWSCGVILFALLTGRLPFDDDNIRDLLLKVQKGKYEIVENLSPEATDLISMMLTVDSEKRIKTRDILEHPLIQKYYKLEVDDINQLPSPECATRPVESKSQIDKRILENLVILWHGRSSDSIIKSLLLPEPNPEKTFYSLLLRYRHDHANNKEKDALVRSSSVISKVTHSSSSTSSSSSSNKKRLSYSATSSHKRPVSFQSVKNSKSRDSLHFKDILVPNAPTAGPAYKEYIQQTAITNNSNTTTPERLNNYTRSRNITPSPSATLSKKSSMFLNQSTPTKRDSLLPVEVPVLCQPTTQQFGKSKMKRNSVTTKVLSTYAKLAEVEQKEKGNSDEYGRRTSSDFAALCDVLFGDGSKMNTKIPNSDSMSTINAIVFGNKRASRRIPISPKKTAIKTSSKSKRSSKCNRQSILGLNDIAVNLNFNKSLKKNSNKKRNSSAPIERISKLLNANDLEDFERRVTTDAHKSNFSSAPPKPMSRLDPRYKAYDVYQKRVSQGAEEMLRKTEESQPIEEENEGEAEEEESDLSEDEINGANVVDKTFNRLSKTSGTVKKREIPSTLSDVQVPVVTRKSRDAANTSRYSVLSMYSTKASSKRLSFYLKELDEEINKSSEKLKKDRISRISMIPLDNDDDDDERTIDFNVNLARDQSMRTLNNDLDNNDNNSQNTEYIGRARSASVADVLDDDLCFVDNQNISNSANANKTGNSSQYEEVPKLTLKGSKDTIISKDSENNTTNHGYKLPEIPGSPIKEEQEKRKSQNTFDIYEDAIRRSRQEFEGHPINPETTPNSKPIPPKPISPTSANATAAAPPQELKVDKTRNPLEQLDANAVNNSDNGSKRKSSFFGKLSKPHQLEAAPTETRKSSFTKTLKSLFSQGQSSEPINLNTILASQDLFEAMKSLLSGWGSYGVGDLMIDSRNLKISGAIDRNNSLNVKACKFSCAITSSHRGSNVTFHQTKGSSKSFIRLTEEIRRIFSNEKILVR